MGTPTTIYLSLGSNLGNNLNNLQEAVFRLGQDIGTILHISPVYKSPSWGFDAPPFLNACLALETHLKPKELLQAILGIEIALGRQHSEEKGYQSRSIDIDLLYFGNLILNTPRLTIPHPQLQKRKFVLKPLADIAPQFYHPELQKDSRNLLQECQDSAQLIKLNQRLHPSRESLFSEHRFLAIEGSIGAGKTTLARKIAERYNGKLVLERFADNPFLPKFYEDQSKYAFQLEMSFLADRYQQFMEDTSQFDLFRSFMVSDYDIFKSLIFAKITLQQEEFKLYRKVFEFMYSEIKKPGVYLYLYQPTETLLQNIRKRGREYEQQIPAEYLEKINRGYLDFIKGYPEQNSLILDLSSYNFVEREADFQAVMAQIQAHLVREE